MRACLLILMALFGSAALAAPPQQVNVKYRVLKNGHAVGTVSEHFEHKDQRYSIESTTTASGIYALFAKGAIILRSEGEITQEGLRPLHFEHHRGADPAKLIVADFDWSKPSVTHKYDGKSETEPMTVGTQDRISQLYQFMFQPPQAPQVEFHTSTGRKLNLYRYRVVGEESVNTPVGKLQALHITKQRTRDEDGIDLWLAKSRHYFPVHIVIDEKDGGKLEQKLESLTFTPD